MSDAQFKQESSGDVKYTPMCYAKEVFSRDVDGPWVAYFNADPIVKPTIWFQRDLLQVRYHSSSICPGIVRTMVFDGRILNVVAEKSLHSLKVTVRTAPLDPVTFVEVRDFEL